VRIGCGQVRPARLRLIALPRYQTRAIRGSTRERRVARLLSVKIGGGSSTAVDTLESQGYMRYPRAITKGGLEVACCSVTRFDDFLKEIGLVFSSKLPPRSIYTTESLISRTNIISSGTNQLLVFAKSIPSN
jgi:hypothetical protein